MVRMTAVRAASAPQFEVLLRLKQAENINFAFLEPGHELHPYYLLLKERSVKISDPLQQENESASSSNDEKGGGVMSGLVGMYSSSSDDDNESTMAENSNEAVNPKPPMTLDPVVPATSSEVGEQELGDTNATEGSSLLVTPNKHGSSCTDERKAKRLKRAKMMKGHFALQLMDKSK